ncbi:hypothetical protein ES703_121687 [subsurface metagenome]
MSPATAAIISIVLLLFLFLLRMPVAYVMALVGLLGFCYIVSVGGGLNILAKDLWSMFSSYSLSSLPMFVLMGTIAFYSGMGGRLYDTAYKFLGQRRGGASSGYCRCLRWFWCYVRLDQC